MRRLEMGPEIREKIFELFEYRQLPMMLEKSKIHDKDTFYDKLVKLQFSIYQLDHNLETIWSLEHDDLTVFWDNIFEDLKYFIGDGHLRKSIVNEIEVYQTRELDLRRGLSPLHHDIENLYFYKSCDVRLMRNLIYHADESLEEILPKNVWYEFDLVTEVNDDVEDLYEDLLIYNANRFLFAIYELGVKETRVLFESFVNQTYDSWKGKKSLHVGSAITVDLDPVYRQTLELLEERLGQFDDSRFATSPMLEKYAFEQSRG